MQQAQARIARLEAERRKLLDEMQEMVGRRFAPPERKPAKPKAERPPWT